MAYFTQCTHCHTRFRITDAHLEAYNGQVRCGKCQQVFDARENLQPEQAPEPSKPIAPMPEPQPQKIADEAEHLQQVLASSRVPDKASELTSSTISEAHDRPSLPSDDDIERFDQSGFNLELPDFEAPKTEAPQAAATPQTAVKNQEQNLIAAVSTPQNQALAPQTATPPAAVANAAAPETKPQIDQAAPQTTAQTSTANTKTSDTPQPPPTETFDALKKQAPTERKTIDEATRQAFIQAMTAAQAELEQKDPQETLKNQTENTTKSSNNKIAAYESTENLDDDLPDEKISARDEEDNVVLATRVHLPEEEEEEEDDDGAQSRKTLFFGIAIAASVLLCLQLTFLYRTEISAEVPGARAILESACQSLGCQVPLTQKGEFLRTEWSELTYVPDHPSLVQLSATLRNHAPYPMAYPFLELNLKDSDNHVIARKVFAPQAYLPEERQHMNVFHANSELKIILPMELGTLKSAGYSLVWFYP